MRSRYLPALFLLLASLLFPSAIEAQGIAFFEGTWDEALEAARKQDRILFVDAYATWCGPCKRMAKDVFTTREAGEYFNRYFINVKLDMERGDGLTFREKYPVSAFPTLFFIAPDGEVVHRHVGALDTEALLRTGRFALGKADDSGELAKRYEAGERDPALVLKYIAALNKTGKPSLKVANEYLRNRKEPGSETDLRILLEASTEADSRVFELMLEQRAALEQLVGAEAVTERIEAACRATNAKAIEFNVEDLHRQAVAVMKKQLPPRAADFELDATLAFHRRSGQVGAYIKAAQAVAKARAKTDPVAVSKMAEELFNDRKSDKAVVDAAAGIAGQAARHAVSWEPGMTLAQILKFQGKRKEALRAAQEARERAADPNMQLYIDAFIRDI
jgi:thiol-disulfide isomerase/thioredoxin